MGRPLNKKYFTGENSLNFKLLCTVRISGANTTTAIVRQRSNRKYEVYGSAGDTALANDYTSLAFADTNPDTIVRTGGTAFDVDAAAPAAGDLIRVAGSENTGENDGVYEVASVTATTITLVAGADLVANTADTTATLAVVDPTDTVVATLVQGAPTVDNTMQILVDPVVTGGTESARIINAHQVKTFEGNRYVWNDVAAGDTRGGIEESQLQGE